MTVQRTLIKNARVYTPDAVIERSSVVVNNEGKIEEAGVCENSSTYDRIIDAEGLLLLPGFIDIHIHGGNGYSVMDGTYEALSGVSTYHAKHGTTSFLATTTTGTREAIIKALNCAADSMEKGVPGAEIIGIHLEGPYLNLKRCGAQSKEEIRPSNLIELKEFLEAGNGQLKLATIAPEIENGMMALQFLKDNGVTVSIGHSDATFEQVKEAVKKGASQTTHHFNGMSPVHHREPGVAGAGLIMNEITPEIISDGIHVHPAIVKLLFDTKGPSNICAITDAVACAGLPEGEYGDVVMKEGQVMLKDGSSLAGSTLTMINAFKNILTFTGYSIEAILPSFTLVPARQIHMGHQKGSIEAGKDADFLLVDSELTILSTFVKGKEVYNCSGTSSSKPIKITLERVHGND
ncbi:N-acetylglucosamine-6-phosphate deacetylase [Neobacillus cucumis]|uniref:N-acetylglucosamine-6-phosphate deacetylase n=1 Tax=Neobacillus cucumis TaxID=1740721 RepID=A0A2N5HIK5_9BACI|nr:N-acetylglucosamine-6-phosphate deacetylase [Neobacillus cucumis]PLS05352.1 N-acetylglucosamine-6-phosphate deacetylase [Neobacillus cucumis]